MRTKSPAKEIVDEYFKLLVEGLLNKGFINGFAYDRLFRGAQSFLIPKLDAAFEKQLEDFHETLKSQELHIQSLEKQLDASSARKHDSVSKTVGANHKVSKASNASPKDPLTQILSNSLVAHRVFGAFNYEAGHHLREAKGAFEIQKDVAGDESHYSRAFPQGRSKYLAQGLAKILILDRSFTGVCYKLVFSDYRSDSRMGSHTDYTIFIPAVLEPVMTDALTKDPALMFRLFRAVYPTYYMGGQKVGEYPLLHFGEDPWVR